MGGMRSNHYATSPGQMVCFRVKFSLDMSRESPLLSYRVKFSLDISRESPSLLKRALIFLRIKVWKPCIYSTSSIHRLMISGRSVMAIHIQSKPNLLKVAKFHRYWAWNVFDDGLTWLSNKLEAILANASTLVSLRKLASEKRAVTRNQMGISCNGRAWVGMHYFCDKLFREL